MSFNIQVAKNKEVLSTLKKGTGVYKLEDYQLDALALLKKREEVAVFYSVGTGKTCIVLSDFATDQNTDTLIVLHAPSSIYNSWINEIDKTGYDLDIINWTADKTASNRANLKRSLDSQRKCIYLFNIETLSETNSNLNVLREVVHQRKAICVVIDQSQSIKNIKAVRTKLVHSMAKKYADKIKKKIILEGNSENEGNWELYSQYYFLNPEIINETSYETFKHKYCLIVNQRFQKQRKRINIQKTVGNRNTNTLMRLTHPFTVRKQIEHKKTVYKPIDVEMTTEEKKIYRDMINNKLSGDITPELKEIMDEYNINDDTLMHQMVLLQRIHATCSGIYTEKEGSKIKGIKGVLEYEIPHKEQVIIFGTYRKEVEKIHSFLPEKYTRDFIHGGLSRDNINDKINTFIKGDFKILIGTHRSIGVGLNLQNASYIIFNSNTYSSRARLECEGRINRKGQKKSKCIVYDVFAHYGEDYSLDKDIFEKIQNKIDLSNEVYKIFKKLNEDIKGIKGENHEKRKNKK